MFLFYRATRLLRLKAAFGARTARPELKPVATRRKLSSGNDGGDSRAPLSLD
jgi:hypothetical protein